MDSCPLLRMHHISNTRPKRFPSKRKPRDICVRLDSSLDFSLDTERVGLIYWYVNGGGKELMGMIVRNTTPHHDL